MSNGILCRLSSRLLTMAIAACVSVSTAHGVIIQDDQYNASLTHFAGNVSTTDHLHGLAGTHSGFQSSDGSRLNNGLHGDGGDLSAIAWVSEAGATSTWNLGNAPGGGGWNITSIRSIASWNSANFSNQHYDILIQKVGESGFTLLTSVVYEPGTSMIGSGGSGSTQVTLTDDSGFLATNVQAVRFQFSKAAHTYAGGSTTFRELDLFAVQAVPEPNSSLLMLSGLLVAAMTLFAKRRWQRVNR